MKGALALALLSSAAWSIPAQAQQQPTSADPAGPATGPVNAPEAADIVVTALKQGSTALQAPATITMLQPAALSAKNIVSANQLNAVVPGLTMSVGVGSLPGTSFRGLGSNSAVFGLEPSVAEYIDGVYMPHARDYVAPLYDIDHIEFIKGTQSTLLGKNTSLGAISIVNRRPSRSFGYEVRYVHSFNIDGDRVEAAVNLPVSETLQVRASAFASREHGYLDNVYVGRSEPRKDDLSGRLSLAWAPSTDFDLLATYQHDYRRLRGQSLEVVSDPAGTVAARARAVGAPFDTLATSVSGSASAGIGGTVAGREPYDKQKTDRLNAIANLRLGDHTLTSQTSYARWTSPRLTDLDFTAANLFNIVDDERSRTFTQELRLSSPKGGRFDYLVGLFYFYNRWNYGRIFGGSPTNSVAFPLVGQAVSRSILPTRAYSAFASGTFEIVDGLKLDGGLRYTHERKTGSFVRATTGTLAASFPNAPFTVYAPQVTKPLDYNVGLRFEPTSTVLLYGSYSKGSKSGGFQDAPTTTAGAPFRPETAYSAEVGAKLRLPGGYITAALFNTRVKGFQTSYTTPVGIPPVAQTVVGNSNVRSRGFEANASYRLVPGLTVSGSIVRADSVFTDSFPANASIARKGDQLTRSPKWSGTADIAYEQEVGGSLTLFGGANIDFASRTLYQFRVAQPTAPFGEGRHLIDARLGLRSSDRHWELAVIGTNLANRRYIDFATSISAGGGAYYGSFNRPRVIAIQATIKQ